MTHEDQFARSVRELEAAARELSVALRELSDSLGKLRVQIGSDEIEPRPLLEEDERALAVWLEHECWVTLN
ncbi:MAG: hypothetical protein ACOCTG_03935 [Bacteroidota bacterium]